MCLQLYCCCSHDVNRQQQASAEDRQHGGEPGWCRQGFLRCAPPSTLSVAPSRTLTLGGCACRDNRKRDHGQAFTKAAHLQRPLGAPSDTYGYDVDPATGDPAAQSWTLKLDKRTQHSLRAPGLLQALVLVPAAVLCARLSCLTSQLTKLVHASSRPPPSAAGPCSVHRSSASGAQQLG